MLMTAKRNFWKTRDPGNKTGPFIGVSRENKVFRVFLKQSNYENEFLKIFAAINFF